MRAWTVPKPVPNKPIFTTATLSRRVSVGKVPLAPAPFDMHGVDAAARSPLRTSARCQRARDVPHGTKRAACRPAARYDAPRLPTHAGSPLLRLFAGAAIMGRLAGAIEPAIQDCPARHYPRRSRTRRLDVLCAPALARQHPVPPGIALQTAPAPASSHSDSQRGDRRHSRGVSVPLPRVVIDEQLDLVAVRIVQVDRLTDRVVGQHRDLDPALLQVNLGLAQRVEIVADLEGDVKEADVGSVWATRIGPDLKQGDVVVVRPRRQEHHRRVADRHPGDLAQPEHIPVEAERPFDVADLEHDVPDTLDLDPRPHRAVPSQSPETKVPRSRGTRRRGEARELLTPDRRAVDWPFRTVSAWR